MYIITICALNYYEDKYFISLFTYIRHKARIYNHRTYTKIIIKKI